jgi:small-conductance mechanosensitive channel
VPIEQFLAELWSAVVEYAPRITGAAILLLAGWAIGRLLGKGVSRLLQRAGIADSLGKTVIGRALARSGITSARFLEVLVRWFVYLVAVLAVVDVLQIPALTAFVSTVVQYLPNFIAGIFILFVGLVVVDFLGDAVGAIGREAKVELAPILSLAVKLFLYLTVIVIALTMMKIDVTILNEFAKAIAWGTAIGIAIGLGLAFGWGLKDYVAKNIDKWVSSAGTIVAKGEDFWSWYTRSKEEKEPT